MCDTWSVTRFGFLPLKVLGIELNLPWWKETVLKTPWFWNLPPATTILQCFWILVSYSHWMSWFYPISLCIETYLNAYRPYLPKCILLQSVRTRGVMSSQKPQTPSFRYTTNEFLELYSNYLIIIHRNTMSLFIRCHDHVFLLSGPENTHRPCETSPFGFGHIWRGPWHDPSQLVVLMRLLEV